MIVTLDKTLAGIARLGVLRLSGITLPADGGEMLWQRLCSACDEIQRAWSGHAIAEIPGVQEARSLYRSVGLDPTKTRPSSEALLRRVVKGKGLFRIHPLVDLFNLVSLSKLLPVGLYDESKISGGTVTVCVGKEGWGFDGIRKDRVNVAGRLCIADDIGPFGSPTSDSLRTSIEGPVERALAVFFQPSSGDPARMDDALDSAMALCAEHLNAHVEEKSAIGH
jgi:DNA/RNA-binding domain of Phe-tRNA-synthetase-like protein